MLELQFVTTMDTTENEIPLERRRGLVRRRIAINTRVREIMKSYWESRNRLALDAEQSEIQRRPESEAGSMQDDTSGPAK